jgi:mono/diheme cytochrome c family protein
MNRSLVFTATMLASSAAWAADGKALVDRYCVGCHADEVYTRPDRKIRSPETLRLQVLRCNAMTKSGLTDEDIAAITEYLNKSFYRF